LDRAAVVGVDVEAELVCARLRENRAMEVDRERNLDVLTRVNLRVPYLDLSADAGDLVAVLAHRHEFELVPSLGFEAVELEHDRECRAEVRGVCGATDPGDATCEQEEEPLADLRVIAEERGGDLHGQ
jgi:hypothetical protein